MVSVSFTVSYFISPPNSCLRSLSKPLFTHRRHHLCTGIFQFCQKYVIVSEFLKDTKCHNPSETKTLRTVWNGSGRGRDGAYKPDWLHSKPIKRSTVWKWYPPRRSNKAFTKRNNCKDIQKKITSLTTSHGKIHDLQTSTARPQSSLRNGKTSRRKSTRGDGWAPSIKIDSSIYSIICFMLHFFHLTTPISAKIRTQDCVSILRRKHWP